MFDNLENLEPSLSNEIKMVLNILQEMIINPVNVKPIFIM